MKSKNICVLVFLNLLIISNLSLAENNYIDVNQVVEFEKFEVNLIDSEFIINEEVDVIFQRSSSVSNVCSNVSIPVDYVVTGLFLNSNCSNYSSSKGFNAFNIVKVEGQNNLNICIASNKPTPIGYVTSGILHTPVCLHSNSLNDNTYNLTKITNQNILISCYGNYMSPYNSYNPPSGYFYAGNTKSLYCSGGSDNNAYIFNKK